MGFPYAGGQDPHFELDSGLGQGIGFLTGQTYGGYGLAGQSGVSLAASGNLVASHMFAVTGVDAAAGTVDLYNPWGANASGAPVADQASFYAASGAINVA